MVSNQYEKEFKVVTEEEILNIINSLDNKSSSGCDGLSNNMVKSLKNELYNDNGNE